MKHGSTVTPTSTAATLTPPDEYKRIELVHVNNENTTRVYLRILYGGVLEAGPFAIGGSYCGPVFLDLLAGSAAVTVTASTSSNGTGDPGSDVEVTPGWTAV